MDLDGTTRRVALAETSRLLSSSEVIQVVFVQGCCCMFSRRHEWLHRGAEALFGYDKILGALGQSHGVHAMQTFSSINYLHSISTDSQ